MDIKGCKPKKRKELIKTMLKINGIALGSKGSVKGNVRVAIADKDTAELREALIGTGFEFNADNGTFVKERIDTAGNIVYTRLTLVVSTLQATSKAKATAKETETIVVE